jgi:hypothetical protein
LRDINLTCEAAVASGVNATQAADFSRMQEALWLADFTGFTMHATRSVGVPQKFAQSSRNLRACRVIGKSADAL